MFSMTTNSYVPNGNNVNSQWSFRPLGSASIPTDAEGIEFLIEKIFLVEIYFVSS